MLLTAPQPRAKAASAPAKFSDDHEKLVKERNSDNHII